MKHQSCIPGCITVLCMLLAISQMACNEDMESRSLITKFRVLGVQTNPPEAVVGDSIEVRGIYAPVAGQSANVAFVTVDTQWIAALASFLPSNVDQLSEAELQALFESVASQNGLDPTAAANLLMPEFKVIVVPVDATTGVATLPAENIVISAPLVAILKLLGQTSGLPLYMVACSNGTIDEAAIQRSANNLTNSQEIGNLESACIGNDASAIASFKTIEIRVPDGTAKDADPLNQNPRVRVFQIEKTTHPPDSPPGDTGTIICESTDGCRDAKEFRVAVDKADFQYFHGFSREENEMEKMFVSWFATGGEFGADRIRSEDAQAAADAMSDHDKAKLDQILADDTRPHWFTVEWMPPVAGGDFDLWVVVNDLRGGVGYARYHISVQAPNY